LDEEMSKTSGFGSAKWFWPSIFAQFANAGERHKQSYVPATEECDKYNLAAVPCFLIGQS
jgi:hypothetical protein